MWRWPTVVGVGQTVLVARRFANREQMERLFYKQDQRNEKNCCPACKRPYETFLSKVKYYLPEPPLECYTKLCVMGFGAFLILSIGTVVVMGPFLYLYDRWWTSASKKKQVEENSWTPSWHFLHFRLVSRHMSDPLDQLYLPPKPFSPSVLLYVSLLFGRAKLENANSTRSHFATLCQLLLFLCVCVCVAIFKALSQK